MGVILTPIGVLAYAGLVATAIGAFGSSATEAGWRGHWVADWILGTPGVDYGWDPVVGQAPLWLHGSSRPAPGLFLVSALGGVVFAVAAVVDNLSGGYSDRPLSRRRPSGHQCSQPRSFGMVFQRTALRCGQNSKAPCAPR